MGGSRGLDLVFGKKPKQKGALDLFLNSTSKLYKWFLRKRVIEILHVSNIVIIRESLTG